MDVEEGVPVYYTTTKPRPRPEPTNKCQGGTARLPSDKATAQHEKDAKRISRDREMVLGVQTGDNAWRRKMARDGNMRESRSNGKGKSEKKGKGGAQSMGQAKFL